MNLTLLEETLAMDYGINILPRMPSPGMLYSINGRQYSFVAKSRLYNSDNAYDLAKELGTILEKDGLNYISIYKIFHNLKVIRYDAVCPYEMVTKNGGPSYSDL